jgi:hypothetical protein
MMMFEKIGRKIDEVGRPDFMALCAITGRV